MANNQIFWWPSDQTARLKELISSEPEIKKSHFSEMSALWASCLVL